MLGVTTQSSHSEFLTVVLSLSSQGCATVQCILAEGQVQAPGGDSLVTRADQGGTSPDVQSKEFLLVSAYRLSSRCHRVLELCLVILREVMPVGSGYQVQPWI